MPGDGGVGDCFAPDSFSDKVVKVAPAEAGDTRPQQNIIRRSDFRFGHIADFDPSHPRQHGGFHRIFHIFMNRMIATLYKATT
jgi:hypothetical protein